ncbi:hypothetical protein K456DRAFT_39277 [Colletotrichum gloeosporioides 23]|nr:hypothetical protein K456DRAFT_39277 [Colletotrichum gloeosporioides 23]
MFPASVYLCVSVCPTFSKFAAAAAGCSWSAVSRRLARPRPHHTLFHSHQTPDGPGFGQRVKLCLVQPRNPKLTVVSSWDNRRSSAKRRCYRGTTDTCKVRDCARDFVVWARRQQVPPSNPAVRSTGHAARRNERKGSASTSKQEGAKKSVQKGQ